MAPLVIDIWADVVCPWCFIGERRLRKALDARPGLKVERRWRPYQLRPDLPPQGIAWEDFLRQKFGNTSGGRDRMEMVTTVGAQEGVPFAFERMKRLPNTRDAHRLILWAGALGRQWELAEALFSAHFTLGKNLNEPEVLVEAAAGVGLDAAQARRLLESGEGGAEVDASMRESAGLGISGVPFFVFGGSRWMSGAQPVGALLEVMDAMAGAERPRQ